MDFSVNIMPDRLRRRYGLCHTYSTWSRINVGVHVWSPPIKSCHAERPFLIDRSLRAASFSQSTSRRGSLQENARSPCHTYSVRQRLNTGGSFKSHLVLSFMMNIYSLRVECLCQSIRKLCLNKASTIRTHIFDK